jgi:hypothetical protein
MLRFFPNAKLSLNSLLNLTTDLIADGRWSANPEEADYRSSQLWTDHGQLFPELIRDAFPTIRPEPERVGLELVNLGESILHVLRDYETPLASVSDVPKQHDTVAGKLMQVQTLASVLPGDLWMWVELLRWVETDTARSLLRHSSLRSRARLFELGKPIRASRRPALRPPQRTGRRYRWT